MAGVKPRKHYRSPLRQHQAAKTRQAVLLAARELFISRGYGATTIDAIAERAGVSKPTVFAAVGNKQMLLKTVRDVAFAGDDEPVPIQRRPHVDAIRMEPDAGRAVNLLARHLTEVGGRSAELHEVLHAAAHEGHDELRELWEVEVKEGLAGARFWVRILAEKAPLRGDLTERTATDVMWLLMTPDNYFRLVHQRGWTARHYQKWLADAIGQLLFETVS